MKAIYSYKRFKHHYKPLDETFFKVAACSVKSVSKFYKTTLYTDSYGAYLFESKGITFDKVIVDDEIEKYDGELYCMPKIFSMIKQTEPYVHVDFDTIIFEEIWSPHTITYAYWDIDFSNNPKTDQFQSMIYHYYDPYVKYVKDIFEEELEPKWLRVPNHSFFMVKNPQLVTDLYNYILDKMPQHTLDVCDSPMLIEQFLFFQYLLKHKVDFGFVNEYGTESLKDKINGSYKLFHLFYYWVAEKQDEVNETLDVLMKKLDIENNFKKSLV